MGFLDRMGHFIRSQINNLILENEDPEKILEETVTAMEQELIRMRQGLAEAIATHKRTERQYSQYQKAAQTWHDRAQMALDKGNETLAKEALVKWNNYQTSASPFKNQLEPQRSIINRLKKDLLSLEQQYTEAKTKKSLYIARLRTASASQKMQEYLSDLNSRNIFERVETKIIELESQAELSSAYHDPLERQFISLEEGNDVENEFAKMKARDFNHPTPES
ncbi:phage shock protein A [Aphanothece hegewaldii CCALA 016]|uniref:Phage shock protein A n=1 Tax=Aphanothece hegewaldii CCALA 016 TaxID=2107694 RepID=A0A2T1M001_9CHRO|nr:PspA/IM30 family protein [Aphanothece hegewaldii]PSF37982.1 phage shock protein A [Aphanothece hegewaldii CCALA 016]